MILALDQMDPTVQGILFLVAVVFFLIAAYLYRPVLPAMLGAAGLAAAFFVFMWNAFAQS